MSLPSILEVRSRIEAIDDLNVKRCYQTIYLLGLRVGEACGYKYPSEKKAQPTGMHLTAYEDVYVPNLKNKLEKSTLMENYLIQFGKYPEPQDLAQIKEPVAVFKVVLEKRKGMVTRETGLPLNPIYEPWTKEVFEYITERQNKVEPVFPYYRQELWPIARKLFEGFIYSIDVYQIPKKVNGEILKDEKGKTMTEPVPEHDKPAANHAARHYRTIEVDNDYGITGELADCYFGWVDSRMQKRYRFKRIKPWRLYFANLLIPRQYILSTT